MRVIAGSARRLLLKTPKGNDTRPTQDRIKETLFNILQNDVPGAIFVDLFCGSGGIGIEALSRGARKCYFAENSQEAYNCLLENLHTTHLEHKAKMFKQDAVTALSAIREQEADIIFLDPPYENAQYERVLQALAAQPYVTEYTMIIAEALQSEDFSFADALGFEITREKSYKNNKHVFLRRKSTDKGA